MSNSLISVSDFSNEDLKDIFEKISLFKTGELKRDYKGCSVGLLFEKFSTRTRLSFEVAISKLGAYPVYINKTDTQLSRGESIEETAKMFSLYLDALVYRTSNQKNIEDFAEFSDIPVINALSDSEHPTQIISDIFTIKEMKPERDISDLKIVYIGDGNNIANSLSLIADTLDLNLTVCTPKGYEPSSRTYCTSNPIEAVQDADVVYTDVWTSMGDEGEEKKRMKDFEDFQINPALTKLSKKDYIFMHCLPAHIGEEVTKEVIESPNSAVYSQAENKQYTAMAIIDLFL
ncbi:MAG: ornithine carbamoyltransferase [Spirochaetales bacterium]|nr:ornithine carbamoyltransferase [Spirochaetales bacterium]